ncbi:hypothetical protein CRYUN_Cryun28dG0003100 [Craigia yunnanensis]
MATCVGVNFEGSRGGLAMFWREDVVLNMFSFSNHHMDMEVESGLGTDKRRITRIYGEPEAQNRKESWALMRRLAINNQLSWLILGDFNEILWNLEKTGRSLRTECGLEDLGFVGRWFTWERGNTKENNVKERLDRCLANKGWCDLLPDYCVSHLTVPVSDHSPSSLKLR